MKDNHCYKIFFFILSICILKCQLPVFHTDSAEHWADSVLKTLSVREKLAQMLMIPAYGQGDVRHIRERADFVRKEKVGGIIWMQGSPVRQLKSANYLQSISRVPLLYAIDGEWGLSMRLDSTLRFPKAMVLAAIPDDSLLYQTGKYIAQELRRMGIHLNFSPVADVNNNPLNPVIGLRSFGENKKDVVRKASLMIHGLQDHGVLSCIKHFPGHGDTDTDSHLDLPLIPHSRQRLDTLELYVFRELLNQGPASVMIGHLYVPALDSTPNLPATLSYRIVSGLLKKNFSCSGLIITDAMNMKGVSKHFPPGTAERMAFKAGCDILLFSENPHLVLDSLMAAFSRGEITEDDLNERCRKILLVKFYTKRYFRDTIPTRNLTRELNRPEVEQFIQLLNQKAVTLLRQSREFPLSASRIKVAIFSKNPGEKNAFVRTMRRFYDVTDCNILYKNTIGSAIEKLQPPDTNQVYVFILTEIGQNPVNHFGIGESGIKLLDSLVKIYRPVVCLNASPYFLNSLHTKYIPDLLVGYENTAFMQQALAMVLCGREKTEGKLPVSAGGFPAGSGICNMPFTIKKENNYFYRIDSIISVAIQEKAFPGCQVFASFDGKTIFHKSYGTTTYDETAPRVHNDMVYDLASLTKILATASALMVLESQGRFSAEHKTLGDYLPELKGSGKDTLPLSMVLTHRAGLQAWIPFYLKTLRKKTHEFKPGYYSKKMNKQYSVRVARNLFTLPSMKDSIFKQIVESPLENYGNYLYSDLGYYYLKEIIERITGKSLKEFTDSIFKECGVQMSYMPYQKHSLSFIVPTEDDRIFRKQLVHGVVHDPGAALLGGVAGHAGLFANAENVGRMMYIFMNKGTSPEGKKIFDSAVVRKYTSYVFPGVCRRGICFDKPEPDPNKTSPVHGLCSPSSFGHSGFTGTFAWADPENKIVFVFLSNRIHPSAENDKINKMHIRGKVHRVIYNVIKKYFMEF